jgi:short-subunit dehydrogenase
MSFAERYGPWAVIAGASEGVGRALARQIAAQGVNCVLVARREGPLQKAAQEIARETGMECVTAAIDLSAPDAHARIVEAVGSREVGLYVSSAGADTNGSRFLDAEIGAWRDLVQRNVVEVMESCHHFGRLMRKRGRGGLLLVNSYAAYGGGGFIATYAGTKAFELCFAEGLWAELRDHGVDMLTLVLHMTDTPMLRDLVARSGMPFPETAANPEDVARFGLERLGRGPIANWGMADDEATMAPSAASRREKILAMEKYNKLIYGEEA